MLARDLKDSIHVHLTQNFGPVLMQGITSEDQVEEMGLPPGGQKQEKRLHPQYFLSGT